MKVLILIAWRNLWRQPRRTLLTIATVSLGLALLLIFLGIGDGGHYQMIDLAVRLGSGHVVIQSKGFQKHGDINAVLDQNDLRAAESWAGEIEKTFRVQTVLRRTFSSGLASSADGATGVRMIGIQPEPEARASLFDEKLVDGRYLAESHPEQVVVGAGVARKLSLKVGEKMVLMAQAAGAPEIQSHLVRIGGIFRTGLEEYDQGVVLMPLATSQQLLLLDGSVHQVAILLETERFSDQVASLGKSRLSQMEVLSWEEALPELRDFIRIDDGGNYVFNLALFVLIGFTVLNTLLMSAVERTREFALLDALGLTPLKRFGMMLLEAFYIAAFSMGMGFIIGFAAHLYLHHYGLPLEWFYSGEISVAGVALDPVIYSDLSAKRIAGSLLLVLGLTLVLAIIPARYAARPGDVHLLVQK